MPEERGHAGKKSQDIDHRTRAVRSEDIRWAAFFCDRDLAKRLGIEGVDVAATLWR